MKSGKKDDARKVIRIGLEREDGNLDDVYAEACTLDGSDISKVGRGLVRAWLTARAERPVLPPYIVGGRYDKIIPHGEEDACHHLCDWLGTIREGKREEVFAVAERLGFMGRSKLVAPRREAKPA